MIFKFLSDLHEGYEYPLSCDWDRFNLFESFGSTVAYGGDIDKTHRMMCSDKASSLGSYFTFSFTWIVKEAPTYCVTEKQ